MARRKRLTPSSRKKDQSARAGWGGGRKGAGRKRELALSTREEIASDYLDYGKKGFDREAAICELMVDFGVTHRMVVRCLDEFGAETKWNDGVFADAVEGLNKSLPKEENKIRKLKSGMYAGRGGLMLRVNADGERQWIFRFWKDGEVCSKELGGGSTISLENARKLAKEARLKLAEDENNAAVERAKSKS
jgi:hypothetical protein